jgi:metal-responsive CopG/Arc/MetJ family transcriptional regulator
MKTEICVTFDQELLEQVDNIRGLIPRSTLLNALVRSAISHNLQKEILGADE